MKILKIILIIIWMAIVFTFSNQKGTESSGTSRKVTQLVVKTVAKDNVDENSMQSIEKIIRKLAHYTIYTIGGVLIINYAYTTKFSTKKKICYSVIFGACYAMTDELHQYFVPGRSARFFDIGIDTLGVATGVCIYVGLIYLIQHKKNRNIR